MSSKICPLSKELINLISAGEVIESPKNVVKELVENAIDAGSSKVKIEITSIDNKIKTIKVSDNGCGMTKEDMEIAIEPHTTSKIHNKDDLFNITTMGFRGEALASIAAVSYLTIVSKTQDSDACQIDIIGGKIQDERIVSAIQGTVITVSNLFFNTPARFKNLKSLQTEISHIISLIGGICQSNPDIKISLIHNNSTILSTNGNGNLFPILESIYGETICSRLLEIKAENPLYKISGYTSDNNNFRSNKNYITIIANGRVIQNLAIQYAIIDAYKSIILIGKYPITTLIINCDPSLIDVNVHPSKLEVRFTDELTLKSLITKTIHDALYNVKLEYIGQTDTIANNIVQPAKEEALKEEVKHEESLNDIWNSFDKPDENTNTPSEQVVENHTNNDNDYNLFDKFDEELPIDQSTNHNDNDLPSSEDDSDIFDEINKVAVDPIIERSLFTFSSLKYLGSYNRTYLLLEDDNDLYLIDQHAAMERCQYEKIIKILSKESTTCVELLAPIQYDFNLSEVQLINQKLEELKQIGFGLEHFGGTTYLLRTIPNWLPKGLEDEFILDAINAVINNKQPNKKALWSEIAKTCACKRSIKANMLITDLEVETLLNDLDHCEMPYTCPHGRPTLVRITKYEIEKMFKRVV